MYEPSADEKTMQLEFKCVYCGIVNRCFLDFAVWDGQPIVHICDKHEAEGCGRYFIVDVVIEPLLNTMAIVSAKDFQSIMKGVKKG